MSMFDVIRNNPRVSQVILVILTLPFAVFGLDAYFASSPGDREVAKVGHLKITAQQFDTALRDAQQRLRGQFGGETSAQLTELVNSAAFRTSVMEDLVRRSLLVQYAQDERLVTLPENLRQLIAAEPAFQQDGRFSQQLYVQRLAQLGQTPVQFETSQAVNMRLQQAIDTVSDSAFVPLSLAEEVLGAQLEKRTVNVRRFVPADFESKVTLDDAAVKATYDENPQRFEIRARLKAQYVVLDESALREQVKVSDEDIAQYYEANRASFTDQPAGRRVRHILIAAGDGADAKTQAREQAQALLEELKQSPERFAELAKEKSADASTAQQGGELGWLTLNGGGLDATFIHAAFALQTPNELSNIVETAAGFHILQLQETRAETYRPLAEVREEIAETLRQQEAVRAYANADEQFSNLVYEHPDSLDPVAKQFGLKVQESDWLDRDAGAAPFDSAQLRAAVFDADAVKGGNNTEAIEIARGVKVAARVLQYEPARVPEFDEVKAQIEKQMRQDAATRMAREAGEALLAQLQKGEAADTKWPPAQTLERANEEAEPLPQEAISAVFSANAQTLPTYVGAALEGGGYGVFRIEKVERPEVTEDDPRLAALRRAYRSALAAQEVEAFLSALRTRYPVEIQPDVLQPTGAGAAEEG